MSSAKLHLTPAPSISNKHIMLRDCSQAVFNRTTQPVLDPTHTRLLPATHRAQVAGFARPIAK